MSSKTPNINLTKPDKTDYVDISVINGNSDIIDTKIKELTDKTGGTTNQLVTITKDTAVGSKSVPIYIDATGKAQTCTELVVDKTNATDTSDKIYLLGAKSQVANTTAYSDNEVSVTNGTLTAAALQVNGTAKFTDRITVKDMEISDGTYTSIYSGGMISLGGINGDTLTLDRSSFGYAYPPADITVSANTETSFEIECPDPLSVDKCLIMMFSPSAPVTNSAGVKRTLIDNFTFVMEVNSSNLEERHTAGYINTPDGCSKVEREFSRSTGKIKIYVSAIEGGYTGKIRYKALWLPINGWSPTNS